ncbi:hypothetical protein RRF57_006187 [Xylaria bambusicola]|uniref:Uncharacterized protein n=1 Tax=Xylaria bambusicola TaxID=326684 RepID=A0AAN7Z6M1_9PEZI
MVLDVRSSYCERGSTYDEAESKPRVALDDMGGVVTTVVALAGEALVSLDLLAEGVFTAGEY